MWLVVAFDIPVEPDENKKLYRCLRKLLISNGFSFPQKSLAWRWVKSGNCADRIQKKLYAVSQQKNCNILMFQIPDTALQRTTLIEEGKLVAAPSPPTPWSIIA